MWDQETLQKLVRDNTVLNILKIEDYFEYEAQLMASPVQLYVKHLLALPMDERILLANDYLAAFWQVFPTIEATKQAAPDVLHEALRAMHWARHHQQENSDLMNQMANPLQDPIHGELLSDLIVSDKNLKQKKQNLNLSKTLLQAFKATEKASKERAAQAQEQKRQKEKEEYQREKEAEENRKKEKDQRKKVERDKLARKLKEEREQLKALQNGSFDAADTKKNGKANGHLIAQILAHTAEPIEIEKSEDTSNHPNPLVAFLSSKAELDLENTSLKRELRDVLIHSLPSNSNNSDEDAILRHPDNVETVTNLLNEARDVIVDKWRISRDHLNTTDVNSLVDLLKKSSALALLAELMANVTREPGEKALGEETDLLQRSINVIDVPDLKKRNEMHRLMCEALRPLLPYHTNEPFEKLLMDANNKNIVEKLINASHRTIAVQIYDFKNGNENGGDQEIYSCYHTAIVSLKYKLFHASNPNPMIQTLLNEVSHTLPSHLESFMMNSLNEAVSQDLDDYEFRIKTLMITGMALWFVLECSDPGSPIRLHDTKRAYFAKHQDKLNTMINIVKVSFLQAHKENAIINANHNAAPISNDVNQNANQMIEDPVMTAYFYLVSVFNQPAKKWENTLKLPKIKKLFLEEHFEKCNIHFWSMEKRKELKDKFLGSFTMEALTDPCGLLAKTLGEMIAPSSSVTKTLRNTEGAAQSTNAIAHVFSGKNTAYLADTANREDICYQLNQAVLSLLPNSNKVLSLEALLKIPRHEQAFKQIMYDATIAMKTQAHKRHAHLSDTAQQFMVLADFQFRVLDKFNPVLAALLAFTQPLDKVLNSQQLKVEVFEKMAQAMQHEAPYKANNAVDFEMLMSHMMSLLNEYAGPAKVAITMRSTNAFLKRMLDEHYSVILLVDQFQKYYQDNHLSKTMSCKK